jgi:limonene-1,2-epoxide hydrolase
MSAAAQAIREFIDAWPRLDPDELAGWFTEDGVYHNMPSGPVQGRETIRGFIAGFIRPWAETRWEVVSLVADGDTVIAERIDRIRVAEKWIELPCCGVFQLRDGRIALWKDYFDLPTYTRALAGYGTSPVLAQLLPQGGAVSKAD